MKQRGLKLKNNKKTPDLVYASVEQGLKEVKLIRGGKLPKKPIQKLLREI